MHFIFNHVTQFQHINYTYSSCLVKTFTGSTIITYSLPFEGNVTLEIHNLLGVVVKVLVNEIQTGGDHSLKYEAGDLMPGVYTATIRLSNNSEELVRTIKLVSNR